MALLHVVLYEPDIPQNAGAVGRLCVAVGAELHLIEPLGFRLTDARLRRAGLDYWAKVKLRRHVNFDHFLRECAPERVFLFSVHGNRSYWHADFGPGDFLVFGSETRGLPARLLDQYGESVYRIPMVPGAVRSLNLAISVGVVVYEALRQLDARGVEMGLK